MTSFPSRINVFISGNMALVVVMLALPFRHAVAQGCREWVPLEIPGIPVRRSNHAMVFDSLRGVIVMVGGDNAATAGDGDTWEWDGAAWTRRLAAGPAPRFDHAMAFDSTRNVSVLFGGGPVAGGSPSSETWTWNGTNWTLVSNSGPSARMDSAMAFDAGRGVVVLFGGDGAGGPLGETWEWDGTSWTLRNASGPPAQGGHAMAYDSTRGVTVLVGQGQTWEWNGAVWSLITGGPALHAGSGGGHAMAFDSNRGVVVLSGAGADGKSTLEWNGVSWVGGSSGFLGSRQYHALAFDSVRNSMVLFGDDENGTWAWNGSEWSVLHSGNPRRFAPAMTYDSIRNVTVMLGGFEDGDYQTWEFNGTNWLLKSLINPGYRKHEDIIFDKARGKTLLFGGFRCTAAPPCVRGGDTWTWDGSTWTMVSDSGPSPRYGHAMAYDEARQVVVLVGGQGSGGLLSDTWEWNGSSWTFRNQDQVPRLMLHSMAYDSRRRVTVLFGGNLTTGRSQETWEWNGSSWTFRTDARPSPRSSSTMAFDKKRGVVILYGGFAVPPDDDTWEWNGVEWTTIGTSGPLWPIPSAGERMVYDAARDRIVYSPGPDVDTHTWELYPQHNFPFDAPRAEVFPPCTGTGYATKNRYISFVPPVVPPGASGIALRVTLGPMPGPNDCPRVPDFSASNGAEMWVGEEVLQGGVTPTGLFALRSTPLFRDWTSVADGVVQVADCNIVPCASYSIQSIPDTEYPGGVYSAPLVLSTTAVWGDIVGATTQQLPNGDVNFIDISALVDRFKDVFGSPLRTWCDLSPNQPTQGVNLNIDFSDISSVVDSFRGASYPFPGPTAPLACP